MNAGALVQRIDHRISAEAPALDAGLTHHDIVSKGKAPACGPLGVI